MAENAGLAADGDGGADLHLLGHDHVEDGETAVFIFHVVGDFPDEQGFTDHPGAAEFAVGFFQIALGEQTFLVLGDLLVAEFLGFQFIERAAALLDLELHGFQFGNLPVRIATLLLHPLDLKLILLFAEFPDLLFQARDLVARGVAHAVSHILPGYHQGA